MLKPAVLALALLLTGCESDAAKLQRLESAAGAARIRYEVYEAGNGDCRPSGAEYGTPDCMESMVRMFELRDEALLAERDLNRFLR